MRTRSLFPVQLGLVSCLRWLAQPMTAKAISITNTSMKQTRNSFVGMVTVFVTILTGLCVSQARAAVVGFTESFETYTVSNPWTAVSPWTNTGALQWGITGTEASPGAGTQSIDSNTVTTTFREVVHNNTTLPITQVTYDYRNTGAMATQGIELTLGNGIYDAAQMISASGGLLMEVASGQIAVDSGGGTGSGWNSVVVQFATNAGNFQARANLNAGAFTAWHNVKTFYTTGGGHDADDLKTLSLRAYNGRGQFDNIVAYVVPEPSSIAMLALGAIAITIRRRQALSDRRSKR